ncbi:MAG: purine-nucleoside phosphorylase [Ginsengibacter sp.]
MEDIMIARDFLKQKGISKPQIGIVLGTGLDEIVKQVDVKEIIPYAEIPGFPLSTVETHKGNLVYGILEVKSVLVMQGRFHAYEGYSMQQIVFPVRVMKQLGVQQLFLSNAAGGVNLNFKKGDLVLVDDHINLLNGNPLSGKNYDELGSRFPDMNEPYDIYLKELLQQKASILNIELKKGVYAAVHGPNLETKAEYRYLKIIGADMVGMSTVPEVIAAVHMQLPCVAVSVITDECDPDNLKPVKFSEIIEVAKKADKKLSQLFIEAIKEL